MALLKVKAGVRPRSLVIAAAFINTATHLHLLFDLVITSGNDGTHMKGSLHYLDRALDLRTKNFPTRDLKFQFLAALKLRLGKGYDVIIEDLGGPNEHLHAEYDPT